LKYKKITILNYNPSGYIDNQNKKKELPRSLISQGALLLIKDKNIENSEIDYFLKQLDILGLDSFIFFKYSNILEQQSKSKDNSIFFSYTVMEGNNNPYINNIPSFSLAKKIALRTNWSLSKSKGNFSARIIVDIHWKEKPYSLMSKRLKTLMFDFNTSKWYSDFDYTGILKNYEQEVKL